MEFRYLRCAEALPKNATVRIPDSEVEYMRQHSGAAAGAQAIQGLGAKSANYRRRLGDGPPAATTRTATGEHGSLMVWVQASLGDLFPHGVVLHHVTRAVGTLHH